MHPPFGRLCQAFQVCRVGDGWIAFGDCCLGLFGGWWVATPTPPRAEPRHCTSSPDRAGGENQVIWLAAFLVLAVVGANLVFICRVSLPQSDGEREFTLSFKGKPGKGVFGASKGLRLTDR